MNNALFLSEVDLSAYRSAAGNDDTSLAGSARALLEQQRATWPMLQKGASTLDSVIVREIEFDHFAMKLQFNPGRIVSSGAKVDAKSIAERKCFLCTEHLPSEQKGIAAGDYSVLVNPFPIFPEHFTIPHHEHIPQRIASSFADMVDLTREMGSRYTLFYNGPRCGASAPDHLHFQAGDRNFMTIDAAWSDLVRTHGAWISETSATRMARVDDGLRRFIVIESDTRADVLDSYKRLYSRFATHNTRLHPDLPELEEPMVNVLTSFENGRWRVIVFLRRRHRPAQFFLEGDAQILFSPASVDFGGVCITPVQKDFENISREQLRDMFAQLSVPSEVLLDVADALR
jgi:hypothetical protein